MLTYKSCCVSQVFFYLNTLVDSDEDPSRGGGQTNFPRAATAEMPGGGAQPRDYFDCSKGLSVYPKVFSLTSLYIK